MQKLIVAATQMACTPGVDENIARAEALVKNAVEKGARIILIQELFETLYFCQEEKEAHFNHASSLGESRAVNHFTTIAKRFRVVLPVSFFEKKGNVYFNSVAVIDADGRIMGIYRKCHIPTGPGYEEKFYFTPGDTGFKVWHTCYGSIGLGICWDQWFPEAARIMALKGAQILFYPTAIGSEPCDAAMDSKEHWQLCMQGHSACNMMPVVASNRIGTESFDDSSITFYGSSFITDNRGEIMVQAGREESCVITAELDLDGYKTQRAAWGLFRDRRPSQYAPLLTHGDEDDPVR